MTSTNISYQLLEGNDRADEAMRLIGHIFCNRVDTSLALGLTEEGYFKAWQDYCRKCASRFRISTCAIDQETNKVVAVMLCADLFPHKEIPEPAELSEERRLLGKLIEDHIEEFKDKGVLRQKPNEYCYFAFGATDDSYCGQGIYQKLYRFSENVIREKGYRFIYSELASPAMQSVMLNKFGYENLKTLPLKDMCANGVRFAEKYVAENSDKKDSVWVFALKDLSVN